jgi:hypothetical protein
MNVVCRPTILCTRKMFAVTLVKSTDKAQQYNKTQVVKYTQNVSIVKKENQIDYVRKWEKKVYVLANDLQSLVCLIAFNLLGDR